MSCVAYEIVEIEESMSEQQGEAQRPKPFIMPRRRVRHDDQVARVVAEVLDFELANGSLPA